MTSLDEASKFDSEKERKARYRREYRQRQHKLEELVSKGLLTLEDKSLDIIKELIKGSVSNPLLGMVSSLVISDVLYRAKIIDLQTAIGINIVVGVVEGSSIADSTIQDITELTAFFGNRPTEAPFQPSATTVVFAENSSDSQRINSLLTREGVKG
jgi:hypothetical protein